MGGDSGIRRDLLRHLPALADASDERLDQLIDLVGERAAKAGTVVLHQGDVALEAFLVLSGEVEVCTDGRPMATLGAGSLIGEVALLVEGPRMSTVTALSDLELLVIDGDAFAVLLDQPEVARQLAAELAQRLRAMSIPDRDAAATATDTAAWDALTPAEQQVARLVAEGLTNSEVGERLFLSRHTVESHLKHIFTKLGIRSRVALAVDVVPPGER